MISLQSLWGNVFVLQSYNENVETIWYADTIDE